MVNADKFEEIKNELKSEYESFVLSVGDDDQNPSMRWVAETDTFF